MSPSVRNPVFGKDLEDCFKDNHGSCPPVFTESLRLLHGGLHSPELFRRSSDKKKVQLLQRAWNLGLNPLKSAKIHDVGAVSDCLLDWVSSLPSPVIPCRLFPAFLLAHRNCSHSQWVHQLRCLFDKLTHQESEVALPLLAFLHEYERAQRSREFKSPSLGQIFGPTLLKAHTQALPLPFPEEVKAVSSLVDCIIADYDLLFRPPPSPTSSPVKKPPCRAKVFSPPKKALASADAHASDKRQQFSARMLPPERRQSSVHPLKHLRICVPNDGPQDENKFAVGQEENMQESGPCAESFQMSPKPIPSAREGSDSEEEDVELDVVVRSLLNGSLSGMLFEPDDKRFLERAIVVSSVASSPQVSCHHSEASLDSSCDEEFALFTL